MSRKLKGLKSCGMNKPTVSKIHVFDFEDLSGFTYTDDNLDFITGYSALNLPATYKPHKSGSNYTAIQNKGNTAQFSHQLTLNFPKLDEEKRSDFIGLKSRKLSVIIEDANGNAWIMGQKFPVKFESLTLQVGARNGSNDYVLVLSSVEKEQLKLIKAPDEDCFASFHAKEEQVTTFSIEDATNNFNWNSLTFSANGQSIHVNTTLSPQLWNGLAIIKAADELKLLNAFSVGGSVTSIQCEYVNLLDLVLITITSNDTRFASLQIGGDFADKGSYLLNISFKAVLTPNLQNANTQLRLTDSIVGEIFTANYGASVSGINANAGGISNDCTYTVSDVLENRTFLFEIPDYPSCPTATYEYFHENTLTPCSGSVELVDYYKGNKQFVTIPHNVYSHPNNTGEKSPKYQRVELNIYGTIYRLYLDYLDFNDDTARLEVDIKTAISQAGANFIDINSVECVEVGNNTRVYFNTFGISPNIANPFFRGDAARTVGVSVSALNGWNQSRVLALNTIAPIGSIITHTTTDGDETKGMYLVNISSSDTALESTPTTNNSSIDKVGLVWAFDESFDHAENEVIQTEINADCSAPNETTTTSKCYDGFTSDFIGSFGSAFLDASSESRFPNIVEVSVNGAISTLIIPATVTPLQNHNVASQAFKAIKGLTVFDLVFDSHAQQWILKYIATPTTTIVYIKDLTYNRNFSFSSINAVYNAVFTKSVNPYQKIKWSSIPTVEPFAGVSLENLTDGAFHYKAKFLHLIKMVWDGSTYELTITRENTDAPFVTSDLFFEFFTNEDYPVAGVLPQDSATMFGGIGGTNTIVVNLSTSFADKTTGLITRYTNKFGETMYLYMNIDTVGTTSDSFYYSVFDSPIVWGTRDALFYVGTKAVDKAPIVQSTVCNGILIGDAVLQSASMLVLSGQGNKVETTVKISGNDRLLIDSVAAEIVALESTSEPENVPFSLALESDNGTTATYKALEVFTEPSETAGYLYEINITALDVGLLTVLSSNLETIAESN